MPASEGEEAGQCDGRAVEKGVEAGGLFVKLEQRTIGELDVEANGVRGAPCAIRRDAADVGPARGGDASSALPQREPRGDDDDAPAFIHGLELQLLAKPGRTRACVCVGSKMTAAMLS